MKVWRSSCAECLLKLRTFAVQRAYSRTRDHKHGMMMFREEKFKTFEMGEDDDASVDIDDQLYFPPEEKVIDISKNIRDAYTLRSPLAPWVNLTAEVYV
ncbi:hypothetical protein SASPL_118831 [Salvia splendens]|uniref:Uncharacterized protein n=1 Tax=Salvia splendens TaxID=180675 RepID=A0A8X8XXG4_SALSN|nr:hypothetical protein SASPL_118831 [Salvia splendens]